MYISKYMIRYNFIFLDKKIYDYLCVYSKIYYLCMCKVKIVS